MAAYTPQSWPEVLFCAGLLPLTLLLGYWIARIHSPLQARLAAWGLVLTDLLLIHFVSLSEPAGLRMLLLIGNVLFAMKAVVAVEEKITAEGNATIDKVTWLVWAGMWPGMRPDVFQTRAEKGREGAAALVLRGLFWLVVGVGCLVTSRVLWDATRSLVASTPFVLVGLSLVLHFGLFNILAGAWRAVGYDTYRLFPAPLTSVYLSEFWSKRWNLPFTEMIQRALYRPLSRRYNRSAAAFAGFCFSGLLHEMAISLPVNAGYGLPMAYFLLHGGLVTMERKVLQPRGTFEKRPWLGRLWTLIWLALPMPILFHPAFLKGVVWPLVGINT